MGKRLFPAKVVLFGEYGMLHNGEALSIPHAFYKGILTFKKEENIPNDKLINYFFYLKELLGKKQAKFEFHLDRFYKDIQEGMFFDSNIPQGYGIGSSGALVAAIYNKYAKKKIVLEELDLKKEKLFALKEIFAQMESFFHGKSSGVDPLICYLNFPLLILSSKEIYQATIPRENHLDAKGAIFLIDSGEPRDTASLIDIFLKKINQESFKKIFREEFMKYNKACIETFLRGDFKPLLEEVKRLSHWVYQNFRPMVPSSLLKIWIEGLLSNDYYLKLCGAGGGGFLLGFAADYKKVEEKLKGYNLEVVFSF